MLRRVTQIALYNSKEKIECELHPFVRYYPWKVNLEFAHAHTDDEGRQK